MSLTKAIPVCLLAVSLARGTALLADGLSPAEALKRFKAPAGFDVRLFASEPEIRQPVTMTFDDRGRMWVIQYLQYPNPAGLKPVKVDRYLRTTYDRVPEPPPKGPKGVDRITILEDTDGDGRADRFKDFLSGLNLASGLALGHGGAFVLQAPYLLFYPDRNRDDVPDSDPEVLLTGFGMEDAHAVANSLQWGPDGWLYGAQGSTVTANIRGIEFQQGIWRYHPRTREFELFAEGGGNTWGLDFDRHGNVIAGTNFGGVVMLHQVQGGYYVKGFSKHGPLHNPHTFGYFEHVPYRDPKQLHSEHVTPGGIVYQGGAYPKQFDQQYIACSLLRGAVFWHRIERQGSSFTSRWGGEFLTTDDRCFRPVDCFVGPDGSVFVADWYDQRASHLDPRDNWDKATGRIYQVVARGSRPVEGLPLAEKPGAALIELLTHPNAWYRREARRVLAERQDRSILPRLWPLLDSAPGKSTVEALWALYVCGGFDLAAAERLLSHPDEDIRTWTIRLLGDARKISPEMRQRLVETARSEPSSVVRNQLACTCKRLSGQDALPILEQLVRRVEDVDDPQIPLLLWWAIEDKAISHRDQVLQLLAGADAWQSPLMRKHMIERIARRFMAEGSDAGLAACARMLTLAPTDPDRRLVLDGIEKECSHRPLREVPSVLKPFLDRLWSQGPPDASLVRLALRLGKEEAYTQSLKGIEERALPEAERRALLETLGLIGKPDCVPVLLRLFQGTESVSLRTAVLATLRRFPDPEIGRAVLTAYPKLRPEMQGQVRDMLCSRKSWAIELLRAIDRGEMPVQGMAMEQVQQLLLHNDSAISRMVEKHWGKVRASTPGELQLRMADLTRILGQGKGDPDRGRPLFRQHCASCHQLFGEGTAVGPDLTGADRRNREFLLTSIVDPSCAIRSEFASYVAETTDGRVLTGLLVDSTPRSVTLLDAKNQRTVLPRDQVAELKASSLSLMPEKLLDTLQPQEVRDLFSFLQVLEKPSGSSPRP